MAYDDDMEREIKAYIRKSGLSENSRKLYTHYLRAFGRWMDENERDWREATEDDALDWMGEHGDWSDSTRYNSAFALRQFYRHHFGGQHQMVLNLKVKRHMPGPQRTLDWDALQQLLASFDADTPKGARDLAMVSLMVDTGLRASEVCHAKIKYLNLSAHTVSVVVKGGEWGVAAYYDYTAKALDNWLHHRQKFALPSIDNIFISVGGGTAGHALSRDGLRAMFRRMGDKAELGLISPHDMRRTMATLAILSGAPSRVVQVAGRWSSINMVERYTRVLTADALAPYSPMDRLMENADHGARDRP